MNIPDYLISKSKLINPSPNRFIFSAKQFLINYSIENNFETTDLKIIFYMYINNVKSVPKCTFNGCNNTVRFISFSQGFSRGCTHIHAKKIATIEKFGVDTPFKSEKIQQKVKKTFLEKYGNEKPCLTNNFKKVMVEKYGTELAMKSNIVKQKQQTTLCKKYGGIGSGSSIISKKVQEKRLVTFFKKIDSLNYPAIRLFDISEFNGVKGYDKKYNWMCKQCNTIFTAHITDGALPLCHKCYPRMSSGISRMEQELFETINCKNKIQSNKTILNGKELDIYMPDNNLAIEFNGMYWHSESNGKGENYHLNKTMKCAEKGIQLIHIFESEWLEKKNIVLSIIHAKLNIFSNRLYARECVVKEIDSQSKNLFLEENHLQGADDSSVYLGLFYNYELVSVMTFSNNKSSEPHQYVMNRFCSKINNQIIGGFSKMLSFFIKHFNPTIIISYIDRRYSVGLVYEKNGFKKEKVLSPNFFIINGEKIWDCGICVYMWYSSINE